MNDCRLFVAEGILEIPQPLDTTTWTTLQTRKWGREGDSVLAKVAQPSPPGRRGWLPPYLVPHSTTHLTTQPRQFCLLGDPPPICTYSVFYEHQNSRLSCFMKIKTFPSPKLFFKKANALKVSQDRAILLLKWHCLPISIKPPGCVIKC